MKDVNSVWIIRQTGPPRKVAAAASCCNRHSRCRNPFGQKKQDRRLHPRKSATSCWDESGSITRQFRNRSAVSNVD